MNILKALFGKRDDSNYQEAKERLTMVREKLQAPKKIVFKDIFVTEIHF